MNFQESVLKGTCVTVLSYVFFSAWLQKTVCLDCVNHGIVYIVGNTANTSDDPEVPASAGPAGADITTAGLLWHSVGPRSTQQV